jgi:hypothetical protein
MQSSLLHYIFHSFYKTFNNHAIASPNSVLKSVMEEEIFEVLTQCTRQLFMNIDHKLSVCLWQAFPA